jgi:hypothetical protein
MQELVGETCQIIEPKLGVPTKIYSSLSDTEASLVAEPVIENVVVTSISKLATYFGDAVLASEMPSLLSLLQALRSDFIE